MNGTTKTVGDPFLLNTPSQKDEKLHTQGYSDHSTIIPRF